MNVRFISVLLVFTLIGGTDAHAQFQVWDCLKYFIGLTESIKLQGCGDQSCPFYRDSNGRIRLNGVVITGPEDYPADAVLERLDIPIESLVNYQKKHVVSVGEGRGTLVETFHKNGSNVIGVDLWYGISKYPRGFDGTKMREFVERWKTQLVRGDATQLPIATDSVDLYLSHGLVGNLAGETLEKTLCESVRVIRPGGEARQFGFAENQIPGINQFLNEQFKDTIEIKWKKIEAPLHNFWGNWKPNQSLLVLRKK